MVEFRGFGRNLPTLGAAAFAALVIGGLLTFIAPLFARGC